VAFLATFLENPVAHHLAFRLLLTVLVAIASMTLATGCSDKASGRLQGSVGTVYDLSFDQVRARLYTSELAIEYVKDNGEVPVRLTLRHEDGSLSTQTYDLFNQGDVTGRSRGVEMPRLLSGTVTFETLEIVPGGKIEGRFEAIVRSGEDRLTLSGEFQTILEIVGHGYPDLDVGSDTSGPDTPDVSPPQPQPDVRPPEPDTRPPEPDTRPPQPVEDAGQPEPDVSVPEPDVSVSEPDVSEPEPDVSEPEPDVTDNVDASVDADAG
jgi:hypothetical protein